MNNKFNEYTPSIKPSANDIIFKDKKELINYVFRQKTNENDITIYYFDNNEKWSSFTCNKEHLKYNIPKQLTYNVRKTTASYYHIPRKIENTYIHKTKFYQVINTLKIGDTLDTFIERYNELLNINTHDPSDISEFETKYPQQYMVKQTHLDRFLEKINISKDVKQFILAINNPIIERYTDNSNTKTFDVIKINISIPMKQYRPDRLEFIKQHQTEIIHVALIKITNNPTYKKYNVPINYLKVDKMIITAQSMLEITFVLKQLNA